ncbi:MAG: hypothetical protein K8S56_08640 [Candidatus Cloacimonetes bacterium]|nr:hypothetical protein [Candidatus Cloacimonadota bacterium]
MDWKIRLQQDTEDFFSRKLPRDEFNFEIIYNAYPERIDNKVPKEVITFIAKTLAKKMAKKPMEYVEFYKYLWKKDDYGRWALAYIMARVIKKDPVFFTDLIAGFLHKAKDPHDIILLLDKAVLPLLKKDTSKYLDMVMKWFKEDNEAVKESLVKLLEKLMKFNPDLIKDIFKRLETYWFNPSAEMITANIRFLKVLGKIDEEFYLSVYEKYKNTRQPDFVEILTGAIILYDEVIEQAVNMWVRSGNARLKRAALNGQKLLNRKKNG